jgi:hypothetical protein
MGIYEENRPYFDEIRNRDAALISREAFQPDVNTWVLNEVWNLDHPQCTEWMRMSYINPHYPRSRYPIQRVMTEAEVHSYLCGQTYRLNVQPPPQIE